MFMKMKKFMIMLMLALVLASVFCSCSSESTEEVQDKVNKENPMFMYIGETIEIDGKTYSASQFRDGTDDGTKGEGYFIVNRTNRQVHYIYGVSGIKSYSEQSINTGLIYEGPLDMEVTEVDDKTDGWISLLIYFGFIIFLVVIILMALGM